MILRSVFLFVIYCLICNNSFAQNAEVQLLERINLESPQLNSVKKYEQANQHAKAMSELLIQYRSKNNNYLRVSKEDVSYIKLHYKKEVEKTIKVADEVLNHYFIFRYDWDMEKTNISYQFKKEIDWSAIPNGDEEWCYMLNRHRFWIALGKAYLLTGK